MSVSSNGAIASVPEGERTSKSFGLFAQDPLVVKEPSLPDCSDSTLLSRGLQTLPKSASNSSEKTGECSDLIGTTSTLATTINLLDSNASMSLTSQADISSIKVVVEGVGTGSTDIGTHLGSYQYEKTQEAICILRKRVLLGAGIEPSSYCGLCVSSTIETSGQPDVHQFPLTPEFLVYAINNVKNGVYSHLTVLARFVLSTESGACVAADAVESAVEVTACSSYHTVCKLFLAPWLPSHSPLVRRNSSRLLGKPSSRRSFVRASFGHRALGNTAVGRTCGCPCEDSFRAHAARSSALLITMR